MKIRTFFILFFMAVASTISAQTAQSPDGKLQLLQNDNGYIVKCGQATVLDISSVGIGNAVQAVPLSFRRKVEADYQMVAGKRLHCTNVGNEYEATFNNNCKLVVRLYNDGLAFRYELTGLSNTLAPEEHTTYYIPEGSKRWMQQWLDAYEGFFPLSKTYKVAAENTYAGCAQSADGYNIRWSYPALLEPVEGTFVLITEANMERLQSASSLFNDGEYFKVVPDKNNVELSGEWHTPWRIAVIGSLADIVASTLVTDVSNSSQIADTSWIKPGVVSWIYWAYNHGSNDYNIIKKYVDMAVALHLPYVLIDAEWDEMKDGKTIEDAVAYARSQGVSPLIWYNSSVGWVDGAPGPKYRLNKAEDREREFAWCERIGVAGVKIDFFSGDTQMNMNYCIDLLESAARHHLLVNFHGATIPRGWQRTYPNLLTTEGVLGAEWYNNGLSLTNKAASHNATLPFTRNVVGPMDYTPCTFSDSQNPHITSDGHELALTVLFESGLQHLADRPESYLAQPKAVQDFLSDLPSVWDDTRLVGGYPGDFAVIARRSGDTWYVAGINGRDEAKKISLDLSFIPSSGKIITRFADAQEGGWLIDIPATLPTQIECKPRGGFILRIK